MKFANHNCNCHNKYQQKKLFFNKIKNIEIKSLIKHFHHSYYLLKSEKILYSTKNILIINKKWIFFCFSIKKLEVHNRQFTTDTVDSWGKK